MSPQSNQEGPEGGVEAELAALSLALQHILARRAARGQDQMARVDRAPTVPTAPPSQSEPAAHGATHQRPPAAESGGHKPVAASAPAPMTKAAPPPVHAGDGHLKGLAEKAAGAPSLEALRACVADCTACGLASTRTQTVFGEGGGARRILFLGEAPGEEEDRTGRPIEGPAGSLLDDIITKGMGLTRDDVHIANVIKCRPPGSRDPLPEEKTQCAAWLERQIELLDPIVIIPLGRHAAGHLLGVDAPLGRLRGKIHEHHGRKVVPTFHPAYLLRSPQEKRRAWEDIQLAMSVAGLPSKGS